jgi:hypothetical protein
MEPPFFWIWIRGKKGNPGALETASGHYFDRARSLPAVGLHPGQIELNADVHTATLLRTSVDPFLDRFQQDGETVRFRAAYSAVQRRVGVAQSLRLRETDAICGCVANRRVRPDWLRPG